MKTFKITIKQIITNPYIGFALFIKDVFEIVNGLVNNLNFNEIMNYELIVNIIINLVIAIVIYNLLTQYKNKVDKKHFEKEISNLSDILEESLSKTKNQLEESFNKSDNEIKKALVDHAIRLSFYRDVIFRLTIKNETTAFDSISTIGKDRKTYLGFKDEELKSKDKFKMPDLEQPLFYKDDEHWKLLKDDFNNKNKKMR